MTISYTRRGGFRPPRDDERLQFDDDGRFTLWRSVANAVNPPGPIGAFAGQLEAASWSELQALAAAAVAAGDLSLQIPPDSPIEFIEVEGAQGRLGIHAEPEGPWGSLVERLRELLAELTAFPEAALALTVAEDGSAATLQRLGNGMLRIDLRDAGIRAVLWEDGWRNLQDWSEDLAGGEIVDSAPEWSLRLPFDHEFIPAAGQSIVAYVTLTVLRDEQPVAAALESVSTGTR